MVRERKYCYGNKRGIKLLKLMGPNAGGISGPISMNRA